MPYSPELKRVLAGARTHAIRSRESVVNAKDLLRALLMYARDMDEVLFAMDFDAVGLLEDLGVDREWVDAVLSGQQRPEPVVQEQAAIRFSDDATLVLRKLPQDAQTLDLLASIHNLGGEPAELLEFFGYEAAGEQFRDAWLVRLDTHSKQPYFEQIVARVEEAVATGELRAFDRLPPVRQLAASLGIAAGTVARAYAQLERKGILETQRALGTRVAAAGQPGAGADVRRQQIAELLHRPVVAAFHLGASADELREVLEDEIRGLRL